jgi:DNA-binding CsgD family transcriptional regulator
MRIVRGWPGWLMLVGADHHVLARSSALAPGVAVTHQETGFEPCTKWVHTGAAGQCCLDLGAGVLLGGRSVLVQAVSPSGCPKCSHPHAQAEGTPASARLEPIELNDGARAWLVHLDPYGLGRRDGNEMAWHDLVAMRHDAAQEESAWLAQLTTRWVQPLVQARWVGWLRMREAGDAICRAYSGRLAQGLTHAAICEAVALARSRAGHDLPLTVPLVKQADLLHLIPSGPLPGWVLTLLGGHLDGARAAMLHGLVVAVSAVERGRPVTPDKALTGSLLASGHGLTPRELEIVQLVAQGLPDKRIAQHLGLSFHTVRNHLRRVMFKLGVNTRAQIAFALAGRSGPKAGAPRAGSRCHCSHKVPTTLPPLTSSALVPPRPVQKAPTSSDFGSASSHKLPTASLSLFSSGMWLTPFGLFHASPLVTPASVSLTFFSTVARSTCLSA